MCEINDKHKAEVPNTAGKKPKYLVVYRIIPEYYIVHSLFETCFQATILLGLFHPEDDDDMFLRKVG
jgi:hypothetical protein